jgi:hypothetical protein
MLPQPLSEETSSSTRFWRAPDRRALGKILRMAVASAFALFLLDAAMFRTGFYVRYLEPESYAGNFEATLTAGLEKQFKRPHHVLVLGDSQIAEGFSSKVADEAGAAAGWEFFNAAVGGAAMRCWYYMVRDLDPDRTRFDVIVLPLRGYSDVADAENRADRDDPRWVIGRLRLSDIAEFSSSFTTPLARLQAIRETLFQGLVYRRDLREFLRDPATRIGHVNDCRAACADSFYGYEGRAENLNGVWMDWPTNTLHFPDRVSPAVRAEMKLHTNYRQWSVGFERAYRKLWLGRIIELYRGTPAKIVIISLPYRPFPIPYSWKGDSDSFTSQASKNSQVAILDEQLFEDLERPEFFFDVFHLNRTGRVLFTKRLTAAMIQRLGTASRPQ